jgi:hypothetical protein
MVGVPLKVFRHVVVMIHVEIGRHTLTNREIVLPEISTVLTITKTKFQ